MPAGTQQPLPPRHAARARPVHHTAAACRRRRRHQNVPLPLPVLEPHAAAWARQRPVDTALHRARGSTPPPAAPATGCSTPTKTRTKLLAAVEDRRAPQTLTRGSVLCSRRGGITTPAPWRRPSFTTQSHPLPHPPGPLWHTRRQPQRASESRSPAATSYGRHLRGHGAGGQVRGW